MQKVLEQKYDQLARRSCERNGCKEYSISAELAYQQVGSFLVQFSKADAELWIELEKDLINDAQQKHWIEAAFKRSNDLRDEKFIQDN
jgi:hypothetical protein